MNTYEKYMEDLEHEQWFKHHRKQAYYLHRKLKQKGISCNPKKQIVFVVSEKTTDHHVQKLLNEHNYTVQTVID